MTSSALDGSTTRPGLVRRYRITHRTTLDYGGRVRASHNELRMTPITEAKQTTLENRIRVRPMTWSQVYRDAFATHVMVVEAITDHTSLVVESISTVELAARDTSEEAEQISWSRLALPAVVDRYYEYLHPTPLTQLSAPVAEVFADLATTEHPFEAVTAAADRVRDRLTYMPGVTQVQSSATEVWQSGQGVCQDFAHLTIGALRSLSIPARYVSGYLVPKVDAGLGENLTGESHAWVEAWLGEWVPIDPTNGRAVNLDHVVVARGRDYTDVPPFKGIYSGPKTSRQNVSVEFTRLA